MRSSYLTSVLPTALLLLLPVGLAAPAPVQKRAGPTVVAPSPKATYIGKTAYTIENFLGIPFAQAPVGNLRLKPPQTLTTPLGQFDATQTPRACPQMATPDAGSGGNDSAPAEVLSKMTSAAAQDDNTGEDCLTLNIQRPGGTKANAKLPVLFWIYGGGFQLGGTKDYDATQIVYESVVEGKPIIFVAVNYRLGAFGFLPGKEILADGAANLGLQDQRFGLQWVADNIAAFGGDPDKVTIWGESAGSASVLDQMALYNGDNKYKGKALFRGGIMSSGHVVPAEAVDSLRAQAIYDTIVTESGCSGSSDTLACLRQVDYPTYLKAANSVSSVFSYTTVALSYLPRPDGKVLPASPDVLVNNGRYAKVPFIIGDQEDEGTLFGLYTSNLTTTEDVVEYFSTVFYPDIERSIVQGLVDMYPNTTEYGSPFRTGAENEWYPQFKRVSAIIGDVVFTLSRREFLETALRVNPGVPVWSYIGTYGYGTQYLGTSHGLDLNEMFANTPSALAAKSMRAYWISFVYDLDPNGRSTQARWPKWSEGKKLMEFGGVLNSLWDDNFRADAYEYIKTNLGKLKT